ncbi:MAG: hypothetical protein LAO20_08520 [Acidobacteriia bacterium]|nr:hypothetical protein [Terriglobia bacterium]
MKRFGFLLLLAFMVCLATPRVWADDDSHHRTNALEMGAIGLVAASVTGAGVYLLRRRRQ